MRHLMSYESYNISTIADTSTMNNVPVTDYVDRDYFIISFEENEKEPPNKTGRNDREMKNTIKKSVVKFSPA